MATLSACHAFRLNTSSAFDSRWSVAVGLNDVLDLMYKLNGVIGVRRYTIVWEKSGAATSMFTCGCFALIYHFAKMPWEISSRSGLNWRVTIAARLERASPAREENH